MLGIRQTKCLADTVYTAILCTDVRQTCATQESPRAAPTAGGMEDSEMSATLTRSVPHLRTAVATLTAAHPGAACRIERGARLVTAGAVTPIYGIGYLVASESEPGRDYWVQRVNDVLTCDCADCRQRGAPLQARL